MNGVNEIQEPDFQNEVLNADLPVLVDFYAPWCGPCRVLAPALEGVAKAYRGRLKVVKANVENAPQLAAAYGIRGVPTLVFFRGGQVVDSLVGLPSSGVLRTKLDAVTAIPAGVGT